MPRAPSEREAASVLAWLRRRNARNAAARVLRLRAVQALLAVYGLVSAFFVVANWSAFAGPVPALASLSVREYLEGFAGILLIVYGALVVAPIAGSSIFRDPIAYIDAVYTAPFPHRTIVRERLRFAFLWCVILSGILGLLAGDLVGHLLGIDPIRTGVILWATLLLWFWFCLTAGVAFSLLLDGPARPWRGAVAGGTALAILVLVLAGLAGSAGLVVDPATSALSDLGTALIGALAGPTFEVPTGAAEAATLAAMLGVAVGLSVWFQLRDFRLYQSDSAVSAGLGLTVERTPPTGFWARLRRRIRPRYRDLGSGESALRGLNATIIARSGAWWFSAFLGGLFGLIGAAAIAGSLATGTPLPSFDPSSAGPPVFIGFFVMMMVAIFTTRFADPIGVEMGRLLPLSASSICAATVWPSVPLGVIPAVGIALFAASTGLPLSSVALYASLLLMVDLLCVLGSIRAAWSGGRVPGASDAPSGPVDPPRMLGNFGVIFANLLGAVLVSSVATSPTTLAVGLGGLLAVDLVGLALLARSTIRAISAPRSGGSDRRLGERVA